MKSLIFDSFSEATATYSEETIASFRVLNVNCSVSWVFDENVWLLSDLIINILNANV